MIKTFKYLSLIIFVPFVNSCDQRKENILDVIEKPKVEINSSTRASSVIISDSLKQSQGYYTFNYTYRSSTKNNKFEFSKDSGSDSIMGNRIYYRPGKLDQGNNYNVKITDELGQVAEAKLYLHLFYNIPPFCIAYINKTSIQHPNEYEFDASASFDQDKKFGGYIVNYEYKINSSLIFTTQNSKLKHIFSSPGNYQIEIRCQDNDGAWSVNPFKQIINVN